MECLPTTRIFVGRFFEREKQFCDFLSCWCRLGVHNIVIIYSDCRPSAVISPLGKISENLRKIHSNDGIALPSMVWHKYDDILLWEPETGLCWCSIHEKILLKKILGGLNVFLKNICRITLDVCPFLCTYM